MIVSVRFRVSEVAAARSYYEEHGLVGDDRRLQVPGNAASAAIELIEADLRPPQTYRSGQHVYWKIGITVDDLDAYAERVNLFEVGQFLDVGYLGHDSDPAGFCVEFLQTTMEHGTRVDGRREGPRALGQVTLRVSDLDESLGFYRSLGMSLVTVVPVTDRGFSLYFLAFSDEKPPKPDDLEALENREWCWQRPYTTLELLHYHRASVHPLQPPDPDIVPGFDSIVLRVKEDVFNKFGGGAVLSDPDGVRIILLENNNNNKGV